MIGKMVKLIKQCHQTSKTDKNKHAAQPFFYSGSMFVKKPQRKERRRVIKNNEHILLNWVARRAQIGGDYSIPVCSNTLRALSTHSAQI
jgi:hypothetical protein